MCTVSVIWLFAIIDLYLAERLRRPVIHYHNISIYEFVEACNLHFEPAFHRGSTYISIGPACFAVTIQGQPENRHVAVTHALNSNTEGHFWKEPKKGLSLELYASSSRAVPMYNFSPSFSSFFLCLPSSIQQRSPYPSR